MSQRGFIALPMVAWGAIAAGAVILALGVAVKVQTSRLETSKAETVAVQVKFDLFAAKVKQLGEEAAIVAKAKDAQNKALKEKIDETSAKARADLAALYARYSRLRNSRESAGVSSLPSPATGSTSPALATFDRETLDRGLAVADGILQEGAERILLRGDSAIADLNAAKGWAQKLSMTLSEK